MKIVRYLSPVALLMVLLLQGCKQNLPTPESTEQPSIGIDIKSLPIPVADKSTVVGKVVDPVSQKPISFVSIRLAEVYRKGEEGAYVLDTAFSPGAYSDENGIFLVKDIPAGEYVIIVGDVMDVYQIIRDDSDHPKAWNAKSGEILNTGTLLVDMTYQPVSP